MSTDPMDPPRPNDQDVTTPSHLFRMEYHLQHLWIHQMDCNKVIFPPTKASKHAPHELDLPL